MCRHIRARKSYLACLLVQLIGNKNGFNVRLMALIESGVREGGSVSKGSFVVVSVFCHHRLTDKLFQPQPPAERYHRGNALYMA